MATTLITKKPRTSEDRRHRRHLRTRKKLYGTSERPRLVVYRSHKNIEGQLVDDSGQRTILGLSTLAPELRDPKQGSVGTKRDQARAAGKLLAERAREKGIERVVFDRAGYRYHGRVQAFAEGARDGGLKF